MRKILIINLFVLFCAFQSVAQTNPALSISELLAYNARFNPSDLRQTEILKALKPSYLITHLKTDDQKNAFWLNVYNSFMLINLRDTLYEGVYTYFYKKKNIVVAGKDFSLFDIEHEFLRLGKKNKSLGFKKSKLNKDTTWIKMRPSEFDERTVFLMYRGLYGYPPFQIIENADIQSVWPTGFNRFNTFLYDWIKPYIADFSKQKEIEKQIQDIKELKFNKTPFAVQIKNFYPEYGGVKFKEEEKNPWLK